LASLAVWVGIALAAAPTLADETSSGDKLRILYSNRLTFDDRGVPLVTVEIMSHQSEIRLSAPGLTVLPNGDGGPVLRGAQGFRVAARNARPARVREWTVVDRLGVDDEVGAEQTLRRWRARGFDPRAFEIGTVYGVEGEVIDSREVLVAVSPVPAGGGERRAAGIARKFGVDTSVHRELVRRPSGSIVATSIGGAEMVIENKSVLWFSARQPTDTVAVDDVLFGHGGSQVGRERRERRRYFGSVYVTLGNDGKLVVANAVPVDRLLAGLVPSEIFPDAPMEALKAQAVAARTELLNQIGRRHHTEPYLLCSSQQCQVYSGAGREHPRTTRAVRETRGLVMLRAGGGLVDARYSASAGGFNANNDWIWGDAPDPTLRARLDAVEAATPRLRQFARGIDDDNLDAFLALPPGAFYAGANRYARGRFRWKVETETDALSQRVAREFPRVGRLLAIEPLERGVSGRIRSLRLRGASGEATVRGDLRIRRLLGGLKSALFRVRTRGRPGEPSSFVFEGAGFGHGVGMCQTGAIGRAEGGQSYQQILSAYYQGSRVRRLY